MPTAEEARRAWRDLRTHVDTARAALARIGADLQAGRRPHDGDLDALAGVAARFDEVTALLSAAGVGAVRPDLGEIGAAVDRLVGAEAEAALRTLLDRLTRVSGPEGLRSELDAARRRAGDLLAADRWAPHERAEADGYAALVELADLDPAAPDAERVMALDRRARQSLPAAAHALIMPASHRLLVFPSGSPPPAQPSEDGHAERDEHADQRDDESDGRDDESDDRDDRAEHDAGRDDLDEVLAALLPAADPPAQHADTAAGRDADRPDRPSGRHGAGGDVPADGPGPADRAGPAAEAAVPPVGPDLTRIEGDLLAGRRFGLAGWLAHARGDGEASVAARRLAAYGSALRTSVGRLTNAFRDLLSTVDMRELGGDPAGQLLAWSAAVRVCLISPQAGALGLLDGPVPVHHARAAVEELNAEFVRFARAGVAVPQVGAAMRDLAVAEREERAAADAARDLLDTGHLRTIKFARATEVWRSWLQPGGLLEALLEPVANRDLEQLDRVRRQVVELRARGRLDREIDVASRQVGGAGASTRIVAGARDRLAKLAEEVIAVAARWVDACDRRAETRGAGADEWRVDLVTRLRHAVLPLRDAAFADLAAIGRDHDAAVAGAVDAARWMLEEAYDLLDGRARTGDEPSEAWQANAELLRVDGLRLDRATLLPVHPADGPSLADLVEVAGTPPDWRATFEARAAVGDHVATAALVENLRAVDADLAEELGRLDGLAVARATAERDEQVRRLRGMFDRARREGVLDEAQWSLLSSRLHALTARDRLDFGRMAAEARAIGDEFAALHAEAVRAAAASVATRGADLAPDVRARIDTLVAGGQLAAAAEFLELACAGQDLPDPEPWDLHLRRFFPELPDLLAGRSESVLEAVRTSLKLGEPVGEPAAAVLAAAGVDLARTSAARRNAAARALAGWRRLGEWRPVKGSPATQLAGILAPVGFEFTAEARDAGSRTPQGRAWVELTGVRPRAGGALIPAFGSRVSRTGDTLRVLLAWGEASPAVLTEWTSGEPGESVLVLYFGALSSEDRRQLAEEARRRPLPVVAVVDDCAFCYLVLQAEPRLDTAMRVLLPFTAAMPYVARTPTFGDVPKEMFYGRSAELDQVLDPYGSCFVYGGRQLGKSALLREATRRFDDGERRIAVYLPIYEVGRTRRTEHLWHRLWQELAERGVLSGPLPTPDAAAAVAEGVRHWLGGGTNRALLVLLDETDAFLDADAREGRFPNVDRIRSLMAGTGRRVKFVFAGLHQTARFESLANQPLSHFGRPVSVGPLAAQPAHDLLTRPLAALGFTFADDTVPARVLALANNQPALIQLFGHALLTRLRRDPLPPDAPPRTITAEDVEAVWEDNDLVGQFKSRFDLTLNLDHRYKLIAYFMAHHAYEAGIDAPVTVQELRKQAAEWWPQGFGGIGSDEFRGLLTECVELGVLATDGNSYRLRTPNVLRLLGGPEDVANTLVEASSTFSLPDTFDGAAYRRPFGDTPYRSPLTEGQLADILHARNQCRLVLGSLATRVDRVVEAVRQAAADLGGAGAVDVRVAADPHAGPLRQEVDRLAGQGHHLLLADLRPLSVDAAREAVAVARDAVAEARGSGTLGVVLVVDAAQAPVWLGATAGAGGGSFGLVETRRHDVTSLRSWMPATELPFGDASTQAQLLAATGGWPSLVETVIDLLGGDQLAGREEALAGLDRYLDDPDHAVGFVESTGVTALGPVEEAWRCLVTVQEDGSVEDLADLLADEGAREGGRLSAESLAACGLTDHAQIVEVLRALGALAVRDGRLSCEPVLCRASRTGAAAGPADGDGAA
jgi:hypothetical protein